MIGPNSITNSIAVLCDYALLPDRVGGMDYFYWQFDAYCKSRGVAVDWFFPNDSNHQGYADLTRFDSNQTNVENYFLEHASLQKYDVIVTHFIELCTPTLKKIKQKSKARLVVVDHNPRPVNGYPFKKRLEKRIKGLLYASYIDTFVGVSEYTVNEMIHDFGGSIQKKCSVIYNGVIIDDIVPQNQRKTTKPRFLVASHLRESKGIQDLITAVAGLPEAIRQELVIDVYGDGPYRAKLETQIQDLNVSANFCLKGNHPNLKQVFQHYDYMIHPSYMECFSLAILESLAANVPVVTTSVGGNEEAVQHGENGYIFKPGAISTLQTYLKELWDGEKTICVNTRSQIASRFALEGMVSYHFKCLNLGI